MGRQHYQTSLSSLPPLPSRRTQSFPFNPTLRFISICETPSPQSTTARGAGPGSSGIGYMYVPHQGNPPPMYFRTFLLKFTQNIFSSSSMQNLPKICLRPEFLELMPHFFSKMANGCAHFGVDILKFVFSDRHCSARRGQQILLGLLRNIIAYGYCI